MAIAEEVAVAEQLAELADCVLAALRAHEGYVQVFVERSADVHAVTTDAARAGVNLTSRFGVAVLDEAPGAPPRFSVAAAHDLASLLGAGLATRAGRRALRVAEDLGQPVPSDPGGALLPPTLWAAGADGWSVTGFEDAVHRQHAVTDSAGARGAATTSYTRRRCEVRSRGAGGDYLFPWQVVPDPSAGGTEAGVPTVIAEGVARCRLLAGERAGEAVGRSGTTPVVFAPAVGAMFLHELIGHPLEADNFAIASAFARASWRKPVCGYPLGIDDVPCYAGGVPAACDDEGRAVGRVRLVHEGAVTGLLTSRQYARGRLPRTGHGRRRDYRWPSLPRAMNTVVIPGQDAVGDLYTPGKEGLLVVHAIRAGQVDMVTGAFDVVASDADLVTGAGARIALHDVRLAGDTSAALARLEAVGSDTAAIQGTCGKNGQFIPVGLASPTIRFGPLPWRAA